MGGTSEQVSTSDLLTGKTLSNELLSVWWLFDNMEIRFHLYYHEICNVIISYRSVVLAFMADK